MNEENKREKPDPKRQNKTDAEEKKETVSSKNAPTIEDSTLEIKEWASHLSAETRDISWIEKDYAMPDEVSELCRRLPNESAGLHALVGCQGIGKTSALLSIAERLRKSQLCGMDEDEPSPNDIIILKWKRPPDLAADLLRNLDPVSKEFRGNYLIGLLSELQNITPESSSSPTLFMKKGIQNELQRQRLEIARLEAELEKPSDPGLDQFIEPERILGNTVVQRVRYESLIQLYLQAHTVLMDLPDYSKTDIRRAATDLKDIYWIWDVLAERKLDASLAAPNIVISFQKEMFRDHFFLGKMNRINLKPLKAEQMVPVVEKLFPNQQIFSKEALLLLAKMSRGIFRRFLRYITLAINHQEQVGASLPITVDQVREAVPVQVLAEDMDQQLAEIFPRQPDLRTEAVKLLLYLEEHGPISQAKITELLELHNYTVSRLLNKLEDHGYVKRERRGIENVISLVQP